MKNFAKTLAGFVAGLALAAGLSYAANSYYAGYNAQTNQNGLNGLTVSGGAVPVVTGTTGCGTITAVKGGTSEGQFTLGTFATSCAITLTLPVPTIVVSGSGGANGNGSGYPNQTNSAAAPNGLKCGITDLTTGTDTTYVASATTTACVFNAATFVTGDVLQYSIKGY